MTLHKKTKISAPAEKVWPWVSDPLLMLSWNPLIRKVIPVSLGEPKAGSLYRIRYYLLRGESNYSAELMEFEKPSRCVLHLEGGSLPKRGYIQEICRRAATHDPGDEGDRTKRINHVQVVIDPQGRPVVGGSFVVPHVDIYSNVHRFHADGRIEQLLSARKGYANTGDLRVEYLSGLAYLPDGRLLIADDPNNLLRTVDGKRLTDWLGAVSETRETDIDGRPPKARVRRPGGLCVTGDGVLFITPGAQERPKVPEPLAERVTTRQLAAIHGASRRLGLSKVGLTGVLQKATGKLDLAQLSKTEASALISELTGTNGGGR